MWRHIASNALTFFVVGLFLVGGIVAWAGKQYAETGPLDQPICFQVDRGSNMRRVSDALAETGAITSPTIFRIGSDYAEKSTLLKAGSFLLPENASMEEIVDVITRGGANTCGTEIVYRIGVTASSVQVRELDPATNRFIELAKFDPTEEAVPAAYTETLADPDTIYRVAIAEGVTSWQIVDGLSKIDQMAHDVTTVPAEGILAPGSYDFAKGANSSQIITRMVASQQDILATAWANRADGVPVNSPEEALILASIVEKETGIAAERRQVASVFVNRLNRGMKLQTDPTVIYGITEGEGVLGRGLRQSELRRETPWNTYVIPALPPTPIANPGKASIEAALNPDASPFIFFVADGTGGHAFAETLDQHNANVRKWREIEAERASGN